MEQHDITHREIYDRVVRLESKVDRVEQNTADVVKAFNAAAGAFTVLEWLARAAKPILWIAALGTAVVTAWDHFWRLK